MKKPQWKVTGRAQGGFWLRRTRYGKLVRFLRATVIVVALLVVVLLLAKIVTAQGPDLPPIATLPPPLSAQGAAGWRWAAVGQLTRFPAHTEYTEIVATFQITELGTMGYAEFIEAHLEPVVKEKDGVECAGVVPEAGVRNCWGARICPYFGWYEDADCDGRWRTFHFIAWDDPLPAGTEQHRFEARLSLSPPGALAYTLADLETGQSWQYFVPWARQQFTRLEYVYSLGEYEVPDGAAAVEMMMPTVCDAGGCYSALKAGGSVTPVRIGDPAHLSAEQLRGTVAGYPCDALAPVGPYRLYLPIVLKRRSGDLAALSDPAPCHHGALVTWTSPLAIPAGKEE